MSKVFAKASKGKYLYSTILLIIVFTFVGYYYIRPERNEIIGYLSTELTSVSAEKSGKIVKMLVKEGQEVQNKELLFVQEVDAEIYQLAIHNSELKKAIADYNDLLKGSQEPIVAGIQAERDRISTELEYAQKKLIRLESLNKNNFLSMQELEDAQKTVETSAEKLKETEHKLAASKLPAREDRIKSAAWTIEVLKGKIADVQRKIDKANILSPASGRITEVLYNQGTIVKEGDTVLQLLDWNLVYVVIYLSPSQINKIKIGDMINFKFPDNNKIYKAKISYISQDAEFSPPVLFSDDQQDQLLFKVKAYVDVETAKLLPLGLPVVVTINMNYKSHKNTEK